MNSIADHLWQSTLFAGVVWLLTLALRKNHARARHGLWLAASCKFLIPFSVFIALGSLVPRRTAPAITLPTLVVMDEISQPFSAPAAAVIAPRVPSPFPAILLAVWACGCVGITCAWWIRWRRIRSAVRSGSPVPLGLPIKARSSPTLLEPGVFGILRPILLLPEGIFDRLAPAQLQAVIAHELCHVRHRDNLIATIHMFVETVFWFHPLVWWIGKRMVEERERACDEEVLRDLAEPKAYAEGILNVCKLYVESPLKCVSGVSGSNLTKRIEVIMSNRTALRLNFGKKITLAVTGMAALAMPVAIGIMNAPPARAQAEVVRPRKPTFEVATVKPNHSGDTYWQGTPFKGPRYSARNATLRNLIGTAYGYREAQILDGPAWVDSDRYDIEAKVEGQPDRHDFALMFQSLLEDRFQLRVHPETRESSLYALVVARNGVKLGPHLARADDRACSEGAPPVPGCQGFRFGPTGFNIEYTQFWILANALTPMVGRPVVDETGLNGRYDLKLEVTPAPGEPLADSIISALPEQVGLQLQSRKGPVEVLIVDHVERPSEN